MRTFQVSVWFNVQATDQLAAWEQVQNLVWKHMPDSVACGDVVVHAVDVTDTEDGN